MKTLNELTKTEFLIELKSRIKKHEITEIEVISILKKSSKKNQHKTLV